MIPHGLHQNDRQGESFIASLIGGDVSDVRARALVENLPDTSDLLERHERLSKR